MKVRSVWHLSGLSLLLLDYLACVLAVYWAMLFSPRLAVAQPLEVQGFGATLLGMPLFMAVSLHIAGVQDVRAGAKLAETAVLALTACVVGVLGFLFCSILIKYELVGRYVLGLSSFAAPLFVIGSRILVWRLASRHSRNVLFYSDRSDFRWAEDIVSAAKIPLRYVGAVKFEGTQDQKMVVVSIRSDVELIALCEQRGVHDIVVEAPSRLGSEERDLLLSCTAAGVHVSDLGGYVERVCDRVHLPSLTEAWFWSYDIAFAHPVYYAFKRMSDICVALIGLMIGAPVIMLAGMLIKIQDGGPFIYSQVRVGLHGRRFRIYKLRTMSIDAERTGVKWASKRDSRVTGLGRILRRSRFDEIPQFWNILRGDMSFVGPRPERPEFIEVIAAQVGYYKYRHLIKPGLTGWAQINYPYGASIDDAREKLAYDLFYLKYASITKDVAITLRTVLAMVRGAR